MQPGGQPWAFELPDVLKPVRGAQPDSLETRTLTKEYVRDEFHVIALKDVNL